MSDTRERLLKEFSADELMKFERLTYTIAKMLNEIPHKMRDATLASLLSASVAAHEDVVMRTKTYEVVKMMVSMAVIMPGASIPWDHMVEAADLEELPAWDSDEPVQLPGGKPGAN